MVSASSSRPGESLPVAQRFSEAIVPTDHGAFRVIVYRERGTDIEHCAVVRGDVAGKSGVLVRVHSECLTGEVLHSLKCDCREQLDLAMRRIAEAGEGAMLYLRQEGRGIGLGNKIRAYALQEQGVDTVDANKLLGFAPDLRHYDVATAMIHDLDIRSVALLTNNPAKVEALRAGGVTVVQQIAHRITPNDYNRAYLATKRDRMGHVGRLDGSDANDRPLRLSVLGAPTKPGTRSGAKDHPQNNRPRPV